MWVKIFWATEKLRLNKIWSTKILGTLNFLFEKLLGWKKFGSKSCVKIGSVTAEIFLIWTNVTRKGLV